MMKKITLLFLFLLTLSFGYAQNSPITFEADVAVGVNWKNATGIATSIVDVSDPSIGGPTPTITSGAPTGKVGKMITDATKNPWQEAHLDMTTVSVDLTTANKVITVDVYSTTGNDFLLKLINGTAGDMQVSAAHNGTGWEQLSFDFTTANGQYNTLVFFPLYDHVAVDFLAAAATTTAIDNITFVEGSAIVSDPAPTTQPTQPTAAAADVISVFTDITAYSATDLTETWHPGWGQTTIYSDYVISGTSPDDHTSKLKNFGYEGITVASSDVSAMENIHLDVYSVDETSIKIFLKAGAETEVTKTLTPGQWNSIDIPLSEYSAQNFATFEAIKLESGTYAWPNGTSLIYVDNIYFWKTAVDPLTDATLSVLEVNNESIPGFSSSILNYDFPVATGTVTIPQITTATATQEGNGLSAVSIIQASAIPGDATVVVTAPNGTDTETYTISIIEIGPATAAPTPPARATADVLSVFSPAYTDKTSSGVQTFAGATLENYTVDAADDTRLLTAGPGGGAQYGYFAGTDTGFDLTDFTTLHIDIWLDDAGDIGSVLTIQLQNFDSDTGAFQHNIFTNLEVNTLGAGAWIGGDIDLSSFNDIGLGTGNIQQIQLIAQGPAFGPIYFTNLYFHKNTTLSIKDFEIEGLAAYPNPTNSKWTISTRDQEIQAIEVFNVIGKRVLSVKPNALSAKVDASSLSPGVYIATITTEKGTSSRKLIKN